MLHAADERAMRDAVGNLWAPSALPRRRRANRQTGFRPIQQFTLVAATVSFGAIVLKKSVFG
jgi:hypothetical protein